MDDFRLSKYQIGNYIRETMSRTNFEGISGLVQFNDQGDRISRVLYEQLQSNCSGVSSPPNTFLIKHFCYRLRSLRRFELRQIGQSFHEQIRLLPQHNMGKK